MLSYGITLSPSLGLTFEVEEAVQARWSDGHFYNAVVEGAIDENGYYPVNFYEFGEHDHAHWSELAKIEVQKGEETDQLGYLACPFCQCADLLAGDVFCCDCGKQVDEHLTQFSHANLPQNSAVESMFSQDELELLQAEHHGNIAHLQQLEIERKQQEEEYRQSVQEEEEWVDPTVRRGPSKSVIERDMGMVDLLSNGGVFLKYGRGSFGKPSYRFIYVTSDMRQIRWGENEDEVKNRDLTENELLAAVKKGRHIDTAGLQQVLAGRHTEVFKKHVQKKRKKSVLLKPGYGSPSSEQQLDEAEMKCFSLIFEERSLDFEARSRKERDEWVVAFVWLQDKVKELAAMKTDPGASES